MARIELLNAPIGDRLLYQSIKASNINNNKQPNSEPHSLWTKVNHNSQLVFHALETTPPNAQGLIKWVIWCKTKKQQHLSMFTDFCCMFQIFVLLPSSCNLYAVECRVPIQLYEREYYVEYTIFSYFRFWNVWTKPSFDFCPCPFVPAKFVFDDH